MKSSLLKVYSLTLALAYTSSAYSAYLETMSFQKMSFDKSYDLQNYKALQATPKKLSTKNLPPKENYTLEMNLNIKTKRQYYFWQELFKNSQFKDFDKNKKYTFKDFMPKELNKDLLKIKSGSDHKELALFWIDWHSNQSQNNSLWNSKIHISDTDYKNILEEQTKSISQNRIKFGDLILFQGTDDIDSSANTFASVIYVGNGIVLEKTDLPASKSLLKFSFLKDVKERWSKKVLDIKIDIRRIKNNKDFNLATKIQEIKKQDKSLNANIVSFDESIL